MEKVKINIGGVDLEMDKEEVSKAIEAGELKIEKDDLVVYNKDDFESFKENFAGEEYKKGKTAGTEMTIKSAREKYGVEFEGKTIDNFAEAFKQKILTEAKAEPSKKIQELEQDNEKLRNNYSDLEGQFNTFKTDIQQKETQTKKDTTLMSFMPKEGMKVSSEIAILALKNKGVDVDFDENGNAFPVVNGQVVKHEKTLKPVSLENFIPEQITTLGLIEKKSGGNGGKDEPGGGNESSYDKFVSEMEANGIDRGSQKFNEEMNKRISEKTLKI